MLEIAVALAVPRHIGPSLLADRQHCRSPQFASVFIADVYCLTRWVADRVIGPRSELVLMAVERPSVTGTRLRNLKTEERICDYVNPRRGCPLSLAEKRHVLAAIHSEAAKAIEELQIGPWRYHSQRRFHRRETRLRWVPGALGALPDNLFG